MPTPTNPEQLSVLNDLQSQLSTCMSNSDKLLGDLRACQAGHESDMEEIAGLVSHNNQLLDRSELLKAAANNYAAEVTRLQTELQDANQQLQSTQAALEACQSAASEPSGTRLASRDELAAQALVGVLASIRRMPDYKMAVEYAFKVADEFIAQRARASIQSGGAP